MKVACIDQTARQRIALQNRLEEAYGKCRHSVGHLQIAESYPASKEELLINQAPDLVLVGENFSLDTLYTTCREIKARHPDVPLFIFFKPSLFSLRTLRRFEKFAAEVFSTDDPAIRLIHKILGIQGSKRKKKQGKLISIVGVKGGVGTTSVTAGLAHASEALGKSCITLDLSSFGCLNQYLAAQRWQSADYAAALAEGLVPDADLASKIVTTAPNGISLILPPAGGLESRELWLRDSETFELSLSLLELLSEQYDIILVDLAQAEGLLPYAISTRSHSTLLVSSNDPASVHLLNFRLSELLTRPGQSRLQILVNLLHPQGLTHEDVLDFLSANEDFNPSMALVPPLDFDVKAKNWIGTGNSFYTEAKSSTQEALEGVLETLLLAEDELSRRTPPRQGLIDGLLKIANKLTLKRESKVSRVLKALPEPEKGEQNSKPAENLSADYSSDLAPADLGVISVDELSEVEPSPKGNNSKLGQKLYQSAQLVEVGACELDASDVTASELDASEIGAGEVRGELGEKSRDVEQD